MASFPAVVFALMSIFARPDSAAAADTPVRQSARDQAAVDAAISDRMIAELQPIRRQRVILWAAPETMPADSAQAFAAELEAGLLAIEGLTGVKVDSTHSGSSTVHVFVSPRVTVSHVYGGYAHPRYAKAYMFLSPERVKRRTAPYLHELTHIVLWEFGSHSLREGFASYVEGRLASEGVGYNSGVFGPATRAETDAAAAAVLASDLGATVVPWIGRSGATDPAVTAAGNEESRAAFYLLARSFVQYLLDRIDLATFVRLYRADDAESAYRELPARSLEDWSTSWQSALMHNAVENRSGPNAD